MNDSPFKMDKCIIFNRQTKAWLNCSVSFGKIPASKGQNSNEPRVAVDSQKGCTAMNQFLCIYKDKPCNPHFVISLRYGEYIVLILFS